MSRADNLASNDQTVQDFVLDGEVSEQEVLEGSAQGAKWLSLRRLRMGVSASLDTTGFIALPSWLGGLVIQWANIQVYTNGVNGGTATVSLPMAFPSASFGVFAIKTNTRLVNGAETLQVAPTGLSQAVISLDSASGQEGAGNRDVFYLALGK